MGEHFTRFSVRFGPSIFIGSETRHTKLDIIMTYVSHSLVREDPGLIDAPVD